MVIENILLEEAEERFSVVDNWEQIRELNSSFDDDVSKVFKYKTHYKINELKINIYEATYYEYDEDSKELGVSFSFYIFYDSQNEHILYEEQGSSLEVCIHNFYSNITMEYIYKHLRCDLTDE